MTRSFGKEKLDWFKRFLELSKGIPSHDTFARVFAQIDPQAFLDIFVQWVHGHRKTCDQELITIDAMGCQTRIADKVIAKMQITYLQSRTIS